MTAPVTCSHCLNEVTPLTKKDLRAKDEARKKQRVTMAAWGLVFLAVLAAIVYFATRG